MGTWSKCTFLLLGLFLGLDWFSRRYPLCRCWQSFCWDGGITRGCGAV
jgi:hypothetical protein